MEQPLEMNDPKIEQKTAYLAFCFQPSAKLDALLDLFNFWRGTKRDIGVSQRTDLHNCVITHRLWSGSSKALKYGFILRHYIMFVLF